MPRYMLPQHPCGSNDGDSHEVLLNFPINFRPELLVWDEGPEVQILSSQSSIFNELHSFRILKKFPQRPNATIW